MHTGMTLAAAGAEGQAGRQALPCAVMGSSGGRWSGKTSQGPVELAADNGQGAEGGQLGQRPRGRKVVECLCVGEACWLVPRGWGRGRVTRGWRGGHGRPPGASLGLWKWWRVSQGRREEITLVPLSGPGGGRLSCPQLPPTSRHDRGTAL